MRPGTPLPAGDDPTAIEVAVDILTRLHRVVLTASYPFPTLEQVYPESEAQARGDAAHERRVRGEPDRRWAAIWTVHQDCQSWRDDQQSLDEVLDSDEFERLLRDSD